MNDKKYTSMSKKRSIGNAISYVVLILISIIWLFPFFGLIMQSFRSYATEYGGMNDCMYDLYRITGKDSHAAAAHVFDDA